MKYVILTRDGCPYCDAAKALIPADEQVVINDYSARLIVKEGGFGTFPQIFHKGKHIGGYTELLSYRPE